MFKSNACISITFFIISIIHMLTFSLDISRYAGWIIRYGSAETLDRATRWIVHNVHSSPTFSKTREEKTAMTAIIWDYIPAVTGTRHRTGALQPPANPAQTEGKVTPAQHVAGGEHPISIWIFDIIMMSQAFKSWTPGLCRMIMNWDIHYIYPSTHTRPYRETETWGCRMFEMISGRVSTYL